MKIPKQFKLMNVTWNVTFEDLPVPERPGVWAETNKQDQTIILKRNLPKEAKEATFIHELVHVLIFNMGLEHVFNYDSEKEEIFVNAFSNGLYDMLKSKIL